MSNCALTLASWNATKSNHSEVLAWWNGTFSIISAESFPLKENPGVGGIGVVTGFVATGYICWLILLLYYLLEYKPDQDYAGYTNPIDRELLKFLRKRTGNFSPRWGAGLEKCVLLLSDQQIVTGMTILVTGYLQINDEFPIYYWQITIWLAWFSSMSHLATLSVLRNYLKARPMLRVLRLLMMSVLAILLVVALLPTGSPAWLDFPGEQTICYFRSLPASWNAAGQNAIGNAQFLAMSTVIILANAYGTCFIKLFEWSSAYKRLNLRVIPGRSVKRFLDALLWMAELPGTRWSRWTVPLFYKPLLVGFVIARALYDIFESMLWEIIWLMYAILWASLRLFTLRSSRGHDVTSDEKSWWFGQWVSTFQLVIPIFTVIELCYEAWVAIESTTPELPQPGARVLDISGPMLPGAIQYVTPANAPLTDFSTIQSALASINHAQNCFQANVRPYNDNFYCYPWFYGLLTLLLFETAAYATIILSWAATPESMFYFMENGLMTLALATAQFYLPTIYVYALLFVQMPNSNSIAGWVVQRTCRSKSIEVQKKVLVALSIVLMILGNFTMSMSFYYMYVSE